jgi:nicotine blue oxidoreductase
VNAHRALRGPVAGVVLAAGEGRRFGRPKALVELHGETLLDRAVRVLVEGGCDGGVVAVVGAALPGPLGFGAAAVVNPDWRAGMGSSLRLGLAELAKGAAAAAVLFVVDTPGIGPEVVRRLISAYEQGATVTVATYDGKPRNPALIPREHWPEVSSLAEGDVGARVFLAAHPELVTPVECGDAADPADVDTVEDLDRFRH